MRDPEAFETRLTAAYHRYADEVGTDVDPMALARAIAMRPVRAQRIWPRFRPMRLAIVLGLLVVAAIAAVVVGGQPSPVVPTPAVVSNGWIAFTVNEQHPAFRPDSGMMRSGDIYLTREATPPRPTIGFDGDGLDQGCPAFSPDGSRLAYGEGDQKVDRGSKGTGPISGRAVVVVELDGPGEPIATLNRIALPDYGPLPCPEWSPAGTHVAFSAGDGSEAPFYQVSSDPEVWVVDLARGVTKTFPVEPWVRSPEAGFRDQELEWAPDGSSIAVTEPGRIRSIPIEGAEPTVHPVDGGEASSLGWLPSGREIVHLASDNAIRVLGLDGGGDRVIRTAQGMESPQDGVNDVMWIDVDGNTVDGNMVDGNVAVSPDGSRVAFVRRTGREDSGVVVVMDIDGTNKVALPAPIAVDAPDGSTVEVSRELLWSPDGQRLLSRSGVLDGGLLSVDATSESPPVFYPAQDLSLEYMRISDVSWQAVHE